jgi:arylformamidase
MDMDQVELDAAYDQSFYAPLQAQIIRRQASSSELARVPLGAPRRKAYGPTEPEKLDIHRTARPNAPIFAFIHGGVHGSAARPRTTPMRPKCLSIPARIS